MNKHTYIVDRSFNGLHDAIWNPRRLLMTSSSFLFWLCMMYEHVCVCECRHSTCVELRNQPYIIFLTFDLLASGYSRLLDKLPTILLPTPPVMKSTHVQYHAQHYMCNTCPALHVQYHAQHYMCNTCPALQVQYHAQFYMCNTIPRFMWVLDSSSGQPSCPARTFPA